METKYINFNRLLPELTRIKNDFNNIGAQIGTTRKKNEAKKIVSNLDGFISRLKEGNRLSIVNMGIVKAGKSEFFNALIEKKDRFKTGVIPTTRDLQKEIIKLTNGYEAVLIDTPGLDVSDSQRDEQEALKGFQQADLICFVHNPKNGEFDKVEIKYLKLLKSLFSTRSHSDVIFILTKRDQMEDNNLEKVKKKCCEQIKKYIGIHNPQIFSLSSKEYLQGIHDRDPQRRDLFIEESNFIEFKNWLNDYLAEKIDRLNQKRIEEFEKIRSNAISILEEEKQRIENEIIELQDKISEIKNKINNAFETIQKRFKNLPCKDMAEVFKDMRTTLENFMK